MSTLDDLLAQQHQLRTIQDTLDHVHPKLIGENKHEAAAMVRIAIILIDKTLEGLALAIKHYG